MLNPISTITVESALIPATSEPETAGVDLFQNLIAELLESAAAPDSPPVPQPVVPEIEQVDSHPTTPADLGVLSRTPIKEPQDRQKPRDVVPVPVAPEQLQDSQSPEAQRVQRERQERQERQEQQIPLLGKGGVDATSRKHREASFERSGRGGWFKQPLNNSPWLELTAVSAPTTTDDNRLLETTTPSAPQRKEAIFFMAQPPLLREGGVYATPMLEIVPELSESTNREPFPQLILNDVPARPQILSPAMEVTSIKIETVPLPKPDFVQAVQAPVQPEVTTTRQPALPQPIVITPELLIKVPAATGTSPHFAQQDFHNEGRRSLLPETVSITPHLDSPVRFQSHLMPMQSPEPVAHLVELPPQLPLPVAHRVSIDIGEKDSRVVVTLHENRGDVSVKIHAPNEVLGGELRSTAPTLVEAFHRERIPLANMDFTSGYTPTPDDGRQHGNQHRQSFQNRARKFPVAVAPTDQVDITSIDLNA